jgi:hypothetical protein
MIVKDRPRLDRAMAESLRAVAMPRIDRRQQEMLRRQLAVLPARTLLELISRIAVAAGTLLPDLSLYRNLGRTAPLYAELRTREGADPDDVVPLLLAWEPLVVKTNRDAFTLIGILVESAVIEHARTECVRVLREIGRPELAERTLARATALGAPVRAWRERADRKSDSRADEMWIKQHAGILDAMLLPALGEDPVPEEIAVGRELDYVIAERAQTLALLLGFTALMAGALIVSLRWRFARHEHINPLLCLPDAATMARVIGLGVLLPILLYFAYTRWTPLGGRSFGLGYMAPRLAADLNALYLAVISLVFLLAVPPIRRRCQILRIDIPRPTRPWLLALLLAVIPITWLAARLYPAVLDEAVPWILVYLALIEMAVVLLVLFVRCLVGPRRYGAFYGTAARSLIPVFAAAVILIAALTQPWLRAREHDLVARYTTEEAGFTRMEIRLVRRLQSRIAEAARALPDRPE